MYHDLMNLYGDWANAAVLERELTRRGWEAVVEKKSVGDEIDFDAYGFIYIGSGTERSLIACMRDLKRHKDVLIKRVNDGVPVFATGNSHELFGKAVTDCAKKRHEMLGLLDFETVQLNTRITGDCVGTASFIDEKLIGFINRAGGSQKGSVERPFSIEPREGASFTACDEGIRHKNLLGTYMTGPALVRNPPMLKYFTDILTGGQACEEQVGNECDQRDAKGDSFFEYQEKAYETALSKM